MALEPSKTFKGIMRYVRFITSMCGADVYDPNFRFNPLTGFIVVLIISYFTFTILTILKELSWMFTIQAFAMCGSAFQAISKLHFGLFSRVLVSKIYFQLVKMYEDYEREEDARYAKRLMDSCYKQTRFIIGVGISYMIGASGMVITPLAATFLTDKQYLIMHFHLPGIDVSTELGFWLTQGIHVVIVVMGAIGLYAGDMVIIVYLLQSFVYADLLELKVDRINKQSQIENSYEAQRVTSNLLVDIAKWHQNYTRFIDNCNDMFYVMVSVQVTSSAVCIVITIFCLLTSDWIGGYSFIIVIIPNLYLYCILGTMLETGSDKFMYEIYNISFYHLKPSQRRFVVFMLAKSQKQETIRILGVLPLSVSTALAITKNIYSITMMMAKFLASKST